MKLSLQNEFDYDESMEWFDPILENDTKLFIDPFLVFKSKIPIFKNSHDRIIGFFEYVFNRAATTNRSNNPGYRNLIKTLSFPELDELCLGYSNKSTKGLGSGSGFGKIMLEAIYDSINMGKSELTHFEELGIFNEGIGCDRISDITARLILIELIEYTVDVATSLEMEMGKFVIKNGNYNHEAKRWEPLEVFLPINKTKDNKGIILVPKEFLRKLPTIDANDFWDFCWNNKNEELRDQLNINIKENLRKSDIVDLAKKNRTWVEEYSKYKEGTTPKPYDFSKDESGVYNWHDATLKFAKQNPLSIPPPMSEDEFDEFLELITDRYEDFVENNGGNKLLWNDKPRKPKREEASQFLFTGITKTYCESNNIDISREANIGRGPVDFKFSQGYVNRALFEIKKANNGKFWNGIQRQLPKYMEAEGITIGYFIVLVFTDSDMEKIEGIEKIAQNISKKLNYDIRVKVIDAEYAKASASVL